MGCRRRGVLGGSSVSTGGHLSCPRVSLRVVCGSAIQACSIPPCIPLAPRHSVCRTALPYPALARFQGPLSARMLGAVLCAPKATALLTWLQPLLPSKLGHQALGQSSPPRIPAPTTGVLWHPGFA